MFFFTCKKKHTTWREGGSIFGANFNDEKNQLSAPTSMQYSLIKIYVCCEEEAQKKNKHRHIVCSAHVDSQSWQLHDGSLRIAMI